MMIFSLSSFSALTTYPSFFFMDLVRAALRLLIWYHRQREEGFTICSRLDKGDKEIIREIVIQGTE